MCDPDGVSGDMLLGYRWNESLPSSGSISNSYVMSIGRSEMAAYNAWDDHVDDLCGEELDHSAGYSWIDTCSPSGWEPWLPGDLPDIPAVP